MNDLRYRILDKFPESRLTPLSPEKVARLRTRYPGAPSDYLEFLNVVGYGRVGEMRLSIYSGPIEPSDIYDAQTASGLPGVLLVADDFQGCCYGYDTSWTFGEVDERGTFVPSADVASFVKFIEVWLFGP